ncbi:O-antigen ligase family protein, partial [Candidatus Thioglobus sp.]|nr:O-antigen ligase family protein [Candidatus Thioglobus sp.]
SEKLWIWSIVLLNSLVLLSSYRNFSIDFSSIDALTRFLFAIPVYFLARKIGINLEIFFVGGAIGAIFMGVYAYYQIEMLGYGQAVGMTDHNYFGQLSLLLTFIAFVGLAYYSESKWRKYLFLLASLAGFYAVMAASSRGVWIAIPAITILVLRYSFPQVGRSKKIVGFLSFIMIIVSVYITNISGVKNRVDSVVDQTVSFFQTGEVSGSAGLRLEMWHASIIMIKDSYGLGAGDQGYSNSMRTFVDQKRVHPSMKNFDVEPHNYYLKTFVGQGIMGVALLFMILGIPLNTLFKSLKNIRHKNTQFTAILGIGIILCYMDFMISNTTLDVQLMSLFLGFTLFPLLGNFYYEKYQLKHET